ncbi:MAG: hypothetical protein V3U87_02550 [Methylococcaceae bacterium]
MKKLDLTWKSRTLLFQNSSWKLRKSEKEKASFDGLPSSDWRKEARQYAKGFRKSKSKILMFIKLCVEKGNADDYHAIEKTKSKRTEVTELYIFVITRKINLPQFF